jgi:glycosyltransferase involved in cell wall biosynthesis
VNAEISVVVPTRNRRDLLPLTLQTVLAQRGVELEAIIVDDGSIDDTGQMIATLGDARVRVIRHETPLGVATARNHGWHAATGEWVAFVDDDDLWAPTKLADQLRVAREVCASWAYGGAVNVSLDLRVVGGKPPPSPRALLNGLPRWNLVPGGCSNVIVTRAALDGVGGFDSRLVNLADWDLWIRLAQLAPPACVAKPLIGYRLHGGNSSLDLQLILREADIVAERYGLSMDRGAIHHYLGWLALRTGRRGEAVRQFARAAVLGEVLPVAGTLCGLASGLVRARLGLPTASSAWRVEAESWLAHLRR